MVTGVFSDGDYAEAHQLIETSKPGSNGVLCLPYLVGGERFPVMNPNIRGAYVGLDPDTAKADMMRAALEGVAFSIRQGMESFDAKPTEISLIGGGARENAWCQILADVLSIPSKCSPMPIFCQQWQWPRWYSMYQTCCNQYANALYTSRILTPHAHMPTHTGDS